MDKLFVMYKQVLPGITNIRGNDVVFENGKEHPFDAIIFATGFNRSTNQWLKVHSSFFLSKKFELILITC